MSVFIFALVIPILAIIILLSFIYIRVLINPLKRIPGLSLKHPIFGCYGEHIKKNCRLIDNTKLDGLKYGPIRTSFMFFGRIRLDISDPYWIKVRTGYR